MQLTPSQGPVGRTLLISLGASALLVWLATALADRLLAPPPQAGASVPAQAVAAEAEAVAAAEAQAAAERSRVMREREAAEKRLRQQKAADMERLRDAQRSALMEERERKQEAWLKFHKPSKRCENPPDNAAIVACSNAYLRDQQRFEAQWAADNSAAP